MNQYSLEKFHRLKDEGPFNGSIKTRMPNVANIQKTQRPSVGELKRFESFYHHIVHISFIPLFPDFK